MTEDYCLWLRRMCIGELQVAGTELELSPAIVDEQSEYSNLMSYIGSKYFS